MRPRNATRGRGRAAARLAALAAAAALGAGCGPGPAAEPGFSIDATVGGITLRGVTAGVVKGTGEFTLYVSDQPDTCLAVRYVPAGRSTLLALRIVPPAAGAAAATVVPPTATPAPGQATGDLTERGGGAVLQAVAAADGSVAWTANLDGSTTFSALDVGFQNETGRVTAAGFTVAACP